MNIIYPNNEMMIVASMVEDVKNRYMMARGEKPKRVFISSDLILSFKLPLEIVGLPVFVHPEGGTFVFCAS